MTLAAVRARVNVAKGSGPAPCSGPRAETHRLAGVTLLRPRVFRID